jgi:hypothetical protein
MHLNFKKPLVSSFVAGAAITAAIRMHSIGFLPLQAQGGHRLLRATLRRVHRSIPAIAGILTVAFYTSAPSHGQLGSNADVGDGGVRKVRARTKFAQQSVAGHSLRHDLSAPPPASQVFATGVASGRRIML